MAQMSIAALAITSTRLGRIARSDQANPNFRHRRDLVARTACGSGRLLLDDKELLIRQINRPLLQAVADKLVASRGLAYYDRLAVAFETSLSERLSDLCWQRSFFSVPCSRRCRNRTVKEEDSFHLRHRHPRRKQWRRRRPRRQGHLQPSNAGHRNALPHRLKNR